MKYPTSEEIIQKALYNIYGDSEAAASMSAAAPQKLYDILDRVQREYTFFFSKQKQEFPITAGDAEYAVLGDIFTATQFGILGRIYGLSVKSSDPLILQEVSRVEAEVYDSMALVSQLGTPVAYYESFMKDTPTDHTISFFPTPSKDMTGILYYKRIYLPEDWSDIEYSHFILDELCDFLVHQLTGELCADAVLKEKAADHFQMAQNYMKKVLSRDGDYRLQGYQNRIVPQ